MRTLDELEDQLDDELAWRRTEMHAFLKQVRRASGNAGDALCRAGVAMLYAHWEGYTKECLNRYLEYIKVRRLKYAELQPGIVALAVEAHLRSSESTSETGRQIERVKLLTDHRNDRARIPKKGLSAKSNLSSTVCCDLLQTVGLDDRDIRLKARLIDYSLLKARNEIAHGSYLAVDKAGYEELHQEVLTMLELIRNLVVVGAEGGRYRRTSG